MSHWPIWLALVILFWVGTLLWLVPMPISVLATLVGAWMMFREQEKRRTA